jgi:LmbE family N-acetylglucosaminyl deacetylase
MINFSFTKQKAGLVIIAHPDDETIWLSGVIMLHPQIEWTVLCLARADDPDRAPKFARVAKELGFHYHQEALDDLEQLPFLKHTALAKDLIKKFTAGKSYDFIITHGANGEYGHRDHKSIHGAVADLAAQGLIRTRYTLYLHYKKPLKRVPLLVPRSGADLLIKLPQAIFEKKKDIMEKIYGFDRQGIDSSYCTGVEAFKIKEYN